MAWRDGGEREPDCGTAVRGEIVYDAGVDVGFEPGAGDEDEGRFGHVLSLLWLLVGEGWGLIWKGENGS